MSAPSSKVSHDKQRVILCWKPDKTIVSSIENLLYWVCGIRQWIGCYVKDEIWITWVGTKLEPYWYNGYITVSTLQKKDTRLLPAFRTAKWWQIVGLSSCQYQDLLSCSLICQVKEHTDVETYNLCQQKLTDFNLSKEAGFRWCANVSPFFSSV